MCHQLTSEQTKCSVGLRAGSEKVRGSWRRKKIELGFDRLVLKQWRTASLSTCVKKFELDDNLIPFNWIVVRIDGCHFHRFSKDRQFEKPNDESALNLMNACAVSMLEQFPDIIFAYGISDEYSFIWKETTEFYQRRERRPRRSITTPWHREKYEIIWHGGRLTVTLTISITPVSGC